MKINHKPGDLLKMFREGGVKRKAAMKAAGIKHSGSFQGKSNALGQGGRAAQLKARGVPGGVIGNLARAAHAAPGQKNYHKKKVAAPEKQNLGLALKKSVRSKSATHIHVHIHGDMPQGIKQEREEEDKHEFKHSHKMKRKSSGKKFEDPKGQGEKLEHEEEGKKEFKRKESMHKCKGSTCKHSSHKEKGSRKKASMGLPKLGANQAYGAPGKMPLAMRNTPNPSWVKQKHTKKKAHQK